jgi:hypothetical protein
MTAVLVLLSIGMMDAALSSCSNREPDVCKFIDPEFCKQQGYKDYCPFKCGQCTDQYANPTTSTQATTTVCLISGCMNGGTLSQYRLSVGLYGIFV